MNRGKGHTLYPKSATRTPTFGFITCLLELNVVIPKNKKLSTSDK